MKAAPLTSSLTSSKRLSLDRGGLLHGTPLLILVIVVAFLAIYNLEHYPRTWFDEGSHLHVAKSLVLYARYADYSSEGFRYDGPATGTALGPTVTVPIALVFKAFDIGLLQARLVMVMYLMLTLGMYFVLANHLFGRSIATISTFLLIGSPGIGFMQYGRQVLGEVPALGFFLAGSLLWFCALDEVRPAHLLLSGIAFGLAMATKSQYALMIPPAFLLLWGIDRCRMRKIRGHQIAIPLAVGLGTFGLWYVFQLLYLGPGELMASIEKTRTASAGAIFVFSPPRVLAATKFLFSPEVLYGWTIPGLIYALARIMNPRNPGAPKVSLLSIFVLVWLGWYALSSIAWPRYAFPAVAVSAMFVAGLLVDIVKAFGASTLASRPWLVGEHGVKALSVNLALLVMVLYPLQEVAHLTTANSDRTPQEFARFLQSEVDENSVIETWEPELGFLTNHKYHYPPNSLLDRTVRQKWLDADTAIVYDARAANPEYLVLGRFGRWTGVYAAELANGAHTRVGSVGEYDLYLLNREE